MEAAVTNLTVTPEHTWSEHCLSAVKKFIKNAVVIDNEPVLAKEPVHLDTVAIPLNQPDSTGMGDTSFEEAIPILVAPSVSEHRDNTSAIVQGHEFVDAHTHTLDIRKVSDAFAEAGIACSFVLPCDEDHDEELKISRILSAAKLSDIVVIDWYLHNHSPTLTMRVLKALAELDINEGGRLRLIAVYTGQEVTGAIFTEIKDSLAQGGIKVNNIEGNDFVAKNDSCLVIAINKNEINPTELPGTLFNSFSILADGLIPSFALAAVGAIRKNMHHLVTRFSKELDPAYISNRLITNPPTDVGELMRELLVAECDSAIGHERVADDYLGSEPIHRWLLANEQKITVKSDSKVTVDIDFICQLLKSGIGDSGFNSADGQLVKFPVEKRHMVSQALAGGDVPSIKSQNSFSRLVTFKREAINVDKSVDVNSWRPSITTGTLLMRSDERYFLCLTPACDTLRLKGNASFVFLEALKVNDKYSAVLKTLSGDDVKLKFDRKRPNLSTFVFSPDYTQRVRGIRNIGITGDYIFMSTECNYSFHWAGEIRYGGAASEMAQLVGNWMRIGINDSEYLRLIDAGRILG